jgi:hypothetical protein
MIAPNGCASAATRGAVIEALLIVRLAIAAGLLVCAERMSDRDGLGDQDACDMLTGRIRTIVSRPGRYVRPGASQTGQVQAFDSGSPLNRTEAEPVRVADSCQ